MLDYFIKKEDKDIYYLFITHYFNHINFSEMHIKIFSKINEPSKILKQIKDKDILHCQSQEEESAPIAKAISLIKSARSSIVFEIRNPNRKLTSKRK